MSSSSYEPEISRSTEVKKNKHAKKVNLVALLLAFCGVIIK